MRDSMQKKRLIGLQEKKGRAENEDPVIAIYGMNLYYIGLDLYNIGMISYISKTVNIHFIP